LELDGEVVFGAYGHLDGDKTSSDGDRDHGYFVFDTRTGSVKSLDSIDQLNAAAGHSVHLVESQYFRSQDPHRIWLRRVENCVYYAPPILAFLYCVYRLIRLRICGDEPSTTREEWTGSLGLGR
jgi:hypothetical protein